MTFQSARHTGPVKLRYPVSVTSLYSLYFKDACYGKDIIHSTLGHVYQKSPNLLPAIAQQATEQSFKLYNSKHGPSCVKHQVLSLESYWDGSQIIKMHWHVFKSISI